VKIVAAEANTGCNASATGPGAVEVGEVLGAVEEAVAADDEGCGEGLVGDGDWRAWIDANLFLALRSRCFCGAPGGGAVACWGDRITELPLPACVPFESSKAKPEGGESAAALGR